MNTKYNASVSVQIPYKNKTNNHEKDPLVRIGNWLCKNIGDRTKAWDFSTNIPCDPMNRVEEITFVFSDEDHAAAFKLTWGDYVTVSS